jgi:hypothetical protein
MDTLDKNGMAAQGGGVVDLANDIVHSLEKEYGSSFGAIGMKKREILPEGDYTFSIENAFLNRSKTSNRKQLVVECRVVDSEWGETLGASYTMRWGLETAENIQWLNTNLANLSITPPVKPADLLNMVTQLIGICFVGTIVASKDPQWGPNCFINEGARRLDAEKATTQVKTVF